MTLNFINQKVLKPLAEDHLQLNDFGFGDLSNYAEGNEIKYPIMWGVLNNVSFSGNAYNFSLSIVFADIAKDDGSNIIAVQSDMISIAADIAAKLKFSDFDDLEIDDNFVLKPFSERFKDFTSGVVMDIRIKAIKSLNDCESPSLSNLKF